VEAPIRVRAFATLLHWRMRTPLPKWPEWITWLDLSGTALGDAGLQPVARLENLKTQKLQGTRITPRGLRELRRLSHLTSLSLDEAQLSDGVLRTLREAGKLHTLTQATNRAGFPAGSLEEVSALSLCRTPLTEAGLRTLTGFPHLRRLLLHNTRVTGAGVAALRWALPDCEITLGD
jgi:hypothetical protein